MPVLANQRHELYAQELARGKSATEAYALAGFRPNRANAARLKANEHITARVLELQAAGAASAEISVASLLAELEEARSKATSLNQLSAAVRATAEKAKISGLMTQKIELEVNQPEYEPQTAVEVLARIYDRVGERAARALADAFEIPYDEEAIRALINGSNGSQAPARAIEWRPPRADRKREL
jgi:hypothetical protein